VPLLGVHVAIAMDIYTRPSHLPFQILRFSLSLQFSPYFCSSSVCSFPTLCGDGRSVVATLYSSCVAPIYSTLLLDLRSFFTMLWRFSQYCFHFINAIAFNGWYRFAFTFVIAVLGVVSLVLIPCIRRSTQDRLSCIEETMTLLLEKMSDIEDSQRTLEENQNQMLQLLKDLYDQDRQN